MKVALAMIAVLGLGACATDAGPDGGVATYDALKSAQDKCVSQGGKLILRDQGNGRDISAYVCKGI